MRLIDADALKKEMFGYYDCVNERSTKHNYSGDTIMDYEVADLIDDCIDYAPTIDAVPVVRCKDCKHLERYQNANWCEVFDDGYYHPADDDFCSCGERRSDG